MYIHTHRISLYGGFPLISCFPLRAISLRAGFSFTRDLPSFQTGSRDIQPLLTIASSQYLSGFSIAAEQEHVIKSWMSRVKH